MGGRGLARALGAVTGGTLLGSTPAASVAGSGGTSVGGSTGRDSDLAPDSTYQKVPLGAESER